MTDVESTIEKRIKFRSISTTADPNYALNRVEDIYLPRPRSKSEQKCKLKKEEESEGILYILGYIDFLKIMWYSML